MAPIQNNKPQYPGIGKRIRKIREHLKLEQEQMAARLDLHRNSIGQLERGFQLPSTHFLLKLHRQFNVSVEWVLFGRGAMLDKSRSGGEEALGSAGSSGSVYIDPEVAEMLALMERVPLLKHFILGHYHQFKVTQKELFQESKDLPKLTQN